MRILHRLERRHVYRCSRDSLRGARSGIFIAICRTKRVQTRVLAAKKGAKTSTLLDLLDYDVEALTGDGGPPVSVLSVSLTVFHCVDEYSALFESLVKGDGNRTEAVVVSRKNRYALRPAGPIRELGVGPAREHEDGRASKSDDA